LEGFGWNRRPQRLQLVTFSLADMFESTIPFGEPELMRASAYRLYLK